MKRVVISIGIVFYLLLGAQAAVTVTALGYGTEETEPFPAVFTPVSSVDLANSGQATVQGTSGVDTGGRPDNVKRLFDGEAGCGKGYEAQFNKGSLTINFDISVNLKGYVVTEVNTYAGWPTLNGGRADQEYTLTVIGVDGSEKQIVSGTHYANKVASPRENGEVNVWTEVKISDDTGILATGVKAVRFDFLTGANAGGAATYTEFDIIGYADRGSATLGLITASVKEKSSFLIDS